MIIKKGGVEYDGDLLMKEKPYYTLKLVAMITMLSDHLGFMFCRVSSIEYMLLRIIGRASFPLFSFLLAESFFHTKSRWKHLFKICILAILSEPIFDSILLMENRIQNVCFTLTMAYLMMIALERYKKYKYICLPIVVSFGMIGYLFRTEYNFGGILLIAMFWYARANPKINSTLWYAISLCIFTALKLLEVYSNPMVALLQIGVLISFIFILMYDNDKLPAVKANKPLKYISTYFYPGHLLLLEITRVLIGG